MMDAKEFLLTVQKECYRHACCNCAFHGACIRTSNCKGYEEIVDEAIKRAKKLNHVKTYADDFFEKFPNAIKKAVGEPRTCRDLVYGTKYAYCGANQCSNCWNEPYMNQNEEEERQ